MADCIESRKKVGMATPNPGRTSWSSAWTKWNASHAAASTSTGEIRDYIRHQRRID
jgi:hypothetical protein